MGGRSEWVGGVSRCGWSEWVGVGGRSDWVGGCSDWVG